MRVADRLLIAAVALLQARCGILVNRALDEPAIQVGSTAPTSFVYSAIVRDGKSVASVPDVTIEFWSEDETYTPTVALDGSGGFSVIIETCAQRSTPADDVVQSIFVGGEPSPCRRWRADYLLRARAGLRCSDPFGGEHGSALGRMVWLRPCAETSGAAHSWRTLPSR